MEKFTGFADSATGINAFEPPLYISKRCTPRVLLLPFRAIFSLISAILYSVTVVLTEMLSFPLPYSARRSFTLWLVWPVLKLLLYSFGSKCSHIDFSSEPNEMILANLTGPMDVLVLTALVKPYFYLPSSSREDEGRLIGPLGAFCRLLIHKPFKDRGQKATVKLAEIKAKRPVVVFPECVKTNGRGLVKWQIKNFAKTRIIGLLYSKSALPFPSGSISSWLRTMLTVGMGQGHLKVRTIPPERTGKELRVDMQRLLDLRAVDVGEEEYNGFIKAYANKKRRA